MLKKGFRAQALVNRGLEASRIRIRMYPEAHRPGWKAKDVGFSRFGSFVSSSGFRDSVFVVQGLV